MAKGQKFVGRNRPGRVQIEYDVEVGNAKKSVELPFVMAVMADLAGNPTEPLPALQDREFKDIDAGTFDSTMKSMKPRVTLNVPNTLSGDGNLSVDLTFESMDDFSPERIAEKVDGLKDLFAARQQLSHLLANIDGKTKAEDVLAEALKDPALLQSLVSGAAGSDEPGTEE